MREGRKKRHSSEPAAIAGPLILFQWGGEMCPWGTEHLTLGGLYQ